VRGLTNLGRVHIVLAAIATAVALAPPAAAAPSTSSAQTPPTCGDEELGPDPAGGKWLCTFDDEFDSSTGDAGSLNRTWWTPQVTATSGYATGQSGGWACYVDSPNNVSVSGGTLQLTVRKEQSPFQCGSLTTQFTSGMVSTRSKFDQTYGRFEVRALMPQAALPGLHETLWLYPQNLTYGPWPASGEVDFAEFYSSTPLLDIPYVHYEYQSSLTDPVTHTNTTTADCPVDPARYNDYAVVWEPGSFTITVNGNTCLIDHYQASGGLPQYAPFDQPFFILLTQALGAGLNAYDPLLTPLPATMSVDYVRAWTGLAPIGPPVLSPLRVLPRTFMRIGRWVKHRCVRTTRSNRQQRPCTRPVRLRIQYGLSGSATVKFTIARRLPGHRVQDRCLKPSRNNRGYPRCTRFVPLHGAITVNGSQGSDSVLFDGRIGGHRLNDGSYRLTATPSASGQAGAARTAIFTLTG
jgi:beta-glucanase (GH16 family)